MNLRTRMMFVVAMLLPLSIQLAQAQVRDRAARNSSQQPIQPAAMPRVMTFKIAFVDVSEVKKVLDSFYDKTRTDVRYATGAANQLIVSGTEAQISQIKAIVEKLDVKPNSSPVSIFHLKYVEANQASQLLSKLTPGVSIAVDTRTNALVVTGNRERLQMVEALLQNIDRSATPAPKPAAENNYRLSIFWLQEADQQKSKIAPGGEQTGRLPDKRLAPAVEVLQKQGFKNVRLVGEAQVITQAGGPFDVRSSLLGGTLQATGELGSEQKGPIKLQLEVALTSKKAAVASIATELSMQPGKFIVLGVAHADPANHRRSAFVIRIDEAN